MLTRQHALIFPPA